MQVIAHNMKAMYASMQLNINTKKIEKNQEKLSSGYKINRSADDAAGLSISEKMRKRIRALHRGTTNISEGISLIKTADGALEEITNSIQRMRELSIQAYNGTNSKTDREAIQLEIDQLINEIDRTKNSTKYNDIYILKGGKTERKTGVLEGAITEHLEKHWISKYKEVPSWLDVDDNMVVHGSYNVQQEMGGGMLNDDRYIGGNLFSYAGSPDKAPAGINTSTPLGSNYNSVFGGYYGNWTSSINDNPSAKISFSALAETDSATLLYDRMVDLLGTSIGAPCGTCNNWSHFYGISFVGKIGDIFAASSTFYDKYADSDGILQTVRLESGSSMNISQLKIEDGGKEVNAIEAITNLVNKHETDTSLTDEDKQNEAKALSRKIAAKLRDNSVAIMERTGKDHFNRVAKAADPYTLYMYDYRDKDALVPNTGYKSNVLKRSNVMMEAPLLVYGKEPDTYYNYEILNNQRLDIVGSDEHKDRIPIELPNVSAQKLTLSGYNITVVGTETYIEFDQERHDASVAKYKKEVEEYEKKFSKELEEYNALYQSWLNKFEYKTEEKSLTVDIYDYNDVTINGETRKVANKTGTQTITYNVTTAKPPDDPAPKRPNIPSYPQFVDEGLVEKTYEYFPLGQIERLDYALKTVSGYRSYLGATQNRLEHAYENNMNQAENTEASESRIRDTDVAEEMVNYSSRSIILQAGQAVLSQANQDQQSILGLLQG